ncbi:MAG: TolC family protein [Melioribacteraceae bacterium]|nr:TolC family protein [Melioribacteraceae bacterium]
MRLTHLLIVLICITRITFAQSAITIEEAIETALKHNLNIQRSLTDLKISETELQESKQLPNPLFAYEREDLKYNESKVNEWSATGSLPLNFLWNRWSNIGSKEKNLEAQKLSLQNQRLITEYDVREEYFSLHKYSNLIKSLEIIDNKLNDIYEFSDVRYKNGDISGYDKQRISIELNSLKSFIADTKIHQIKHETNLGILIGQEIPDGMLTSISENNFDGEFDEKKSINFALKNRPDLRALAKSLESETEFLSHNKTNIIPNINLSAGYKENSELYKGSIIAVDFEIPLFNRNQKEIDESEIRINFLKKKKNLSEQKIKREVIESIKDYNINLSVFNEFKSIHPFEIFDVSTTSYTEGEISLVEFIDGIKASVEGIILKSDSELKLYGSYMSVHRAIGKSLLSDNNLGVE